jgi:eukaryotic-like serine/threonine-protein kinase
LRQALSGLVAAHKAGIVHRDLKPANIMVDTEGHALLMDFGIARSIGVPAEEIHKGSSRSAPGSFGETMVGAVVGTIHYMAPEQAKGQTVDHRADIYAFGLILRDALVGLNRREGAPTALAELQKRLDAAPVSLRTVDATIPEPLDRIVTRCLAPDPAARYQTTAELEADLNRLDDQGELIPIKRVLGLPVAAAISLLLVLLSSGIWWYLRPPPPPVVHDPISVVIADLQNNTGDPTFDRALEPTLKRALETASFISAYDRAGISSAVGVRPPERLDEQAARELAVKQGLNVVLSGSLDRQGNGYGISIKATQTVTGKVIASVKNRATNKDQLLGAATKLMAEVREALGDDTSDSARQFAMVTMSTASLDVVRHHAAAMEAMSNNKFEEGLQSFQKAVELDPKFGIGYQGKAAMLLNLGKRQEAEQNLKEALRHLDGMTERERYNTRGLYYALVGDYQACVKEFGDMVSRYPASPDAHMSRASCLTYLRELPKAVDGMRRAVAILPKRALYRTALALYAGYASDFQAAEREARMIQEPDPFSALALAFGQLGQGQLSPAIETYQRLGTIGVLGASLASSGLGDVALYEGRFSDAVRILTDGAAEDLAAMNAGRAAAKFTSLAYAQLSRGQTGAAVNAAKKALVNSQEVKIRLLAARVLVEAGEIAEARKLAAGLAKEVQAEPQAYAKIIEGEILLKNKNPQQAINLFSDANRLLDVWLGHFDLGRAYLQADQPLQADSEFDRCLNRRGEVMALFLDEEPTYGYFPPVYYYRGLAREGMKTEGFRDSYREYLKIRGNSTEDALVREVRRRTDP